MLALLLVTALGCNGKEVVVRYVRPTHFTPHTLCGLTTPDTLRLEVRGSDPDGVVTQLLATGDPPFQWHNAAQRLLAGR